MSKLFGAARAASEYIRKRNSRQIKQADRAIDQIPGSRLRARTLRQRLSDFVFGRPKTPPEASAPPKEHAPQKEEAIADDLQLLGRDATYDEDDWKVVMDGMRLTPGSSNVFGYYFEFESRTTGILYVTFQSRGEGAGAGPTYAYYTVPGRKYHEFKKASDSSAGGAVWDYLRIRGTTWGHQHNYRLVDSATGYVPRKVTRRGFAARSLADRGIGKRSYRRNTLQAYNDGRPNRGRPDRGKPNRGR